MYITSPPPGHDASMSQGLNLYPTRDAECQDFYLLCPDQGSNINLPVWVRTNHKDIELCRCTEYHSVCVCTHARTHLGMEWLWWWWGGPTRQPCAIRDHSMYNHDWIKFLPPISDSTSSKLFSTGKVFLLFSSLFFPLRVCVWDMTLLGKITKLR